MESSDMNEPVMQARISALMDGEMAAADFASGASPSAAVPHTAVLHALSTDTEARQTWLQYHQIGDLLRSSELAPLPREQAFLLRFSARLQQEPVQLVPAAQAIAQQAKRSRLRWGGAGAAVASFAAVALVTFSALPSRLVQHPVPITAQVPAGLLGHSGTPQRMALNTSPALTGSTQVMDQTSTQSTAVWSQYLMAHQQLAGGVLPYTPADIHEADLRVAASR
jgi:sigma-E factor negative regulatory protein RseA